MSSWTSYLEIFWVFFITNILGYGGGPATIPLVAHEVIVNYGWVSEIAFFEMLAVANALPGPIATKMSGLIGYTQAGWIGLFIALVATVIPSIILKIMLMNFLLRHKDSPRVKRIANYIRPAIAVLLGIVVAQNFTKAFANMHWIHIIVLAIGSFYLLEKKKTHPALVILCALVYGGIMSGFMV